VQPEPPLLTVAQVAAWLNCSPDIVRGLYLNGKLPGRDIGLGKNKCLRFRKTNVEAYLNHPTVNQPFEFHEDTRDGKPVNRRDEIAQANLRKKGILK